MAGRSALEHCAADAVRRLALGGVTSRAPRRLGSPPCPPWSARFVGFALGVRSRGSAASRPLRDDEPRLPRPRRGGGPLRRPGLRAGVRLLPDLRGRLVALLPRRQPRRALRRSGSLLVVARRAAVVRWASSPPPRRAAPGASRARARSAPRPAALALALVSGSSAAARRGDVPPGLGALRDAAGRGRAARVRDPLDGGDDGRRDRGRRARARRAAPLPSLTGPHAGAPGSRPAPLRVTRARPSLRERPALLGRQRRRPLGRPALRAVTPAALLGAVRDVVPEERLLGDPQEVGVGDDPDDLLVVPHDRQAAELVLDEERRRLGREHRRLHGPDAPRHDPGHRRGLAVESW